MKNNIIFNDTNFTLYNSDCFSTLKKLPSKSVDLIFADPPYFLSSNGISCHSGKQTIVNKGEWDKTISIEDKIKYNRKWIKYVKHIKKIMVLFGLVEHFITFTQLGLLLN